VFISRYREVVIVHFPTNSIGRLLPDFEEFFSDTGRNPGYIYIGFFDKKMTNELITSYIRKEIVVLPNWIMVRVAKMIENGNSSGNLTLYQHGRGHFYPFSLKGCCSFKKDFWNFVEVRKERYPTLLSINKPYVVLCVRELTPSDINDNLRNSDISEFVSLISYISSQNKGLVRMTRIAMTPLPESVSSFTLDYPFSRIKSDFADFKIFRSAEYCISTGFGVDHYASFANIPVATLNCPLMATYLRTEKRFFLPKVFIDSKTQRILSIEEIIERKLHNVSTDSGLRSEGITLVNNSPDDMVRAVKEFESNNYFLSPHGEYKVTEGSKLIAREKLNYLQGFFSEKERSFMQDFDLESMIIISSNWANITQAGTRYTNVYS
jgi:putative glycosyltransferase (TIGR04372 family)